MIGTAVKVMRVDTGEEPEDHDPDHELDGKEPARPRPKVATASANHCTGSDKHRGRQWLHARASTGKVTSIKDVASRSRNFSRSSDYDTMDYGPERRDAGNFARLAGLADKKLLTQALAGGEKTVLALQEKARAAGLLGERQTITDSKSFRSAKAALDVRSHRIGFGRGAIWFWVLPAPPAPEVATPVAFPVDVYAVAPSDRAPETSPCYAENMCGRPHGVPLDWAQGVAILQLRPRPLGIPGHRWRLFVDDSKRFVSAARGRSAPPNLDGILPSYSGAVTRRLTSTLEAQDCCGIWLADRSCKSMLMGRISLPPTEGCEGSIGAQFR